MTSLSPTPVAPGSLQGCVHLTYSLKVDALMESIGPNTQQSSWTSMGLKAVAMLCIQRK